MSPVVVIAVLLAPLWGSMALAGYVRLRGWR